MKDSENRYNSPLAGREGFGDIDGADAEQSLDLSRKAFSEEVFSGETVTGTGDQVYNPEQGAGGPADDPERGSNVQLHDFEQGSDDFGIDPELSVEEAFAQLELLIKRMETDGISLEESFACYEKGIRLVRYCNDRIDRVEKKVRILRGEGGISGEDRM